MLPTSAASSARQARTSDCKASVAKLDKNKLSKDFSLASGASFRDEHDMEVLHCPRLNDCMFHTTTDMVLMLLIVANFLLVVVETDYAAEEDGEVPMWISVCNLVLLAIFAIELSLRLVIHGFALFRSPWFVLDAMVVIPDIVVELIAWVTRSNLPSVSLFRAMRMIRLARAVRILQWCPELFALTKGLVFALKAMFSGTLMIVFFLTVHSVIAVQFIHPLSRQMEKEGKWRDCDDCAEAFNSVARSLLTFFTQLIAGDSWGKVSVPIILEYPITALFFGGVNISVGVGVMNLILAVIVDKAADARENTLEMEAVLKRENQRKATTVLTGICKELDADESGTLTYSELIDGYSNNGAFSSICAAMDFKPVDLELVFRILDSDGSGDVDYEEFVTQLYNMKNEDSHTLLVFIKCYVSIIHGEIHAEMETLRGQMETLGDHTEILKAHTSSLPGARAEGGGAREMELKKATDQISQGITYALQMSSPPTERERTNDYGSPAVADAVQGSSSTTGASARSQSNVSISRVCNLTLPGTSLPEPRSQLLYM